MSDVLANMTDVERLAELLEEQESGGLGRDIDVEAMIESVRSRVRGQDHAVEQVCRMIRLQWAKKARKRPICNLLFVGPTGVGKTEMCKALAEYLFEDERNMLLFDCGEFSGAEGKSRLVGTPTGYIGAESGGQLTRPMLNNPKRLVVFDEIEKAPSSIFDLFLSMMGDGRLTEQGSGGVADFTQAMIILTSNAEQKAIMKIDEEVSDPQERTNAIKQHLRDSKIFRPEILGRFDKVIVFKKLAGIVVAEIAVLKMQNLAREYGMELKYVGPELIAEAMSKGNKLKDFGVRAMEQEINDMLAPAIVAARDAGVTKIRITVNEGGDLLVEAAV